MVHYNKKYAGLNMHTAHNKRVSGSGLEPSPKSPLLLLRTSDTRKTLSEIVSTPTIGD